MSRNQPYGLFEAYGVEIEYMIVDCETLRIRPIVDRLFKDITGEETCWVECGVISWSNELVNHVLELKVNPPVSHLDGLEETFHENVCRVNAALAPYGARLLPTGAHPLMDPTVETQIWQHEFHEIYDLYNRIFDCHRHGWSNLQSAHLNLPFRDEQEFGQLHAAIRVLLPIIPGLSASTPLLDGRLTGFADTRLETYRHNQVRFPSLTGYVIPEPIFSEMAYREKIFDPIRKDIGPYDPEGILNPYFLNSRGAIARFDRNAIEIRIIDTQECPSADMAVLKAIVSVLKKLVDRQWANLEAQQAWDEITLSDLLIEVIRSGEHTIITHPDYLRLFGVSAPVLSVGDLWRYLIEEIRPELDQNSLQCLHTILEQGTLSNRIVRRLEGDDCRDKIIEVYHALAECLDRNEMLT